MSPKRSRVHPPYKTKYRVSNSAEYDRALINRGSITFWVSPSAIRNWNATPSKKRGGQAKYSDLAIETALTLGLVFHLPLRQTEGFVTSVFELMGLHLGVPDHTTLSRRSKKAEHQVEDTRDQRPHRSHHRQHRPGHCWPRAMGCRQTWAERPTRMDEASSWS